LHIVLRAHPIAKGKGEGKALVTREPLSFWGGVDVATGTIVDRNHELVGEKIVGRVLVFPTGKGSTAGSFRIYACAKRGTAPSAMINVRADPVVAVGAIISGIPLVDRVEKDPLSIIETGDYVVVDANNGLIKVIKKGSVA
jgi:predicted aconitase with swiveling domain